MFIVDTLNNVGRYCVVRGTNGQRDWKVLRAMSGSRYLVRNWKTGEYRSVSHVTGMTCLY